MAGGGGVGGLRVNPGGGIGGVGSDGWRVSDSAGDGKGGDGGVGSDGRQVSNLTGRVGGGGAGGGDGGVLGGFPGGSVGGGVNGGRAGGAVGGDGGGGVAIPAADGGGSESRGEGACGGGGGGGDDGEFGGRPGGGDAGEGGGCGDGATSSGPLAPAGGTPPPVSPVPPTGISVTIVGWRPPGLLAPASFVAPHERAQVRDPRQTSIYYYYHIFIEYLHVDIDRLIEKDR